MVRRSAALLIGAFGAALAYLLVVPALPDIGGTGDVNTLLSDLPSMLLLGACVLAMLPGRDDAFALALLALGAGLLAGALTVADASAGANVTKALFGASVGMFLAWALADPAVVVAVPLFVAGIDIASVVGGPSELLARDSSRAGEFLSLSLPAWGGGRAGVVGVADLVFFGFFAASAWRFGLRPRLTSLTLLVALPTVLAVQLALDSTIPALPFLAAALLVPNIDLLPELVRARSVRAPG